MIDGRLLWHDIIDISNGCEDDEISCTDVCKTCGAYDLFVKHRVAKGFNQDIKIIEHICDECVEHIQANIMFCNNEYIKDYSDIINRVISLTDDNNLDDHCVKYYKISNGNHSGLSTLPTNDSCSNCRQSKTKVKLNEYFIKYDKRIICEHCAKKYNICHEKNIGYYRCDDIFHCEGCETKYNIVINNNIVDDGIAKNYKPWNYAHDMSQEIPFEYKKFMINCKDI
jgi:hypothetical protein